MVSRTLFEARRPNARQGPFQRMPSDEPAESLPLLRWAPRLSRAAGSGIR